MSEIRCAAIDCEYIDDWNCCRLNEVTFNEHYVHTVHNGLQHFWSCKMYEKSEETKRLERMFMECLRRGGIEIYESERRKENDDEMESSNK